MCEKAYEESEFILGEAELLDLDVEQEWTSKLNWDVFWLVAPKDVSRVVKDDIENGICLTIGILRFGNCSRVREP